jgi:hypothetical protein
VPKRQKDSDMENPQEFAAWAFAAGIPDPRYNNVTFQTLIPAPCFPALSQMLWDLGFRHHAELQTKWVPEYAGGDRNIMALGLTATEPDDLLASATEMVVDQFPEVAERLRQMNPENRDEMMREQAALLLSSVQRLQAATSNLDGAWGEKK